MSPAVNESLLDCGDAASAWYRGHGRARVLLGAVLLPLLVLVGACARQRDDVTERASSKRGASATTALAASASYAPTPSGANAATEPRFLVQGEQQARGIKIRNGVMRPSNWGFTDITIDLTSAELRIVSASGGAMLSKLLPHGAVAVVNGGYFENDFRPTLWLRAAGIDLAPRQKTRKGGVFAVAGTRLYIGPLAELEFEPTLAVQSFPLVVEDSGKPGIHSDDGRRAARTIACVSRGMARFILIAAPRGEGPTLYETAALLTPAEPRGFGCSAALNLDGGPSSGVWFAPEIGAKQRLPLAPVAYGIAIAAR